MSEKRLLFQKVESPFFFYCPRRKMFYLRTGDLPARRDLKKLPSLLYPGTEASSGKCVSFLLRGFPEKTPMPYISCVLQGVTHSAK